MARVRSEGWNLAIAGWYLPYCRVFAAQATDCYWDERYDQASSASPRPLEAAVDETRMLFETEMYSPFGRSLVDARHFAEYQALLAAARRYAADPSIGVAFIHFNIPHAPYFYNPEIGRFGRRGYPDDLYADALSWTPFRTPAHAHSAGRALAQMHEAARGFDATRRRPRPLVASFSGCITTGFKYAMAD